MKNMVTPAAPLLTLAIPTYNRAPFLRELLEVLLPQFAELHREGRSSEVQFLISDNAATDNTPDVTAWAQEFARTSGFELQVTRQDRNIGPDLNFAYCLHAAQGKYFWLFGDDDIIREGGLRGILDALKTGDYNLVYLAPEAFKKDWRLEHREDPYRRTAEVFYSAQKFAEMVNLQFTFISGIISNRVRLLQLNAEPPEAYEGSFLIQLSWVFPLLREERPNLILWQRYIAGREANSGGYSGANVFGVQLRNVSRRLLPNHESIATSFTDYALRAWFPEDLLRMRQTSVNPQKIKDAEVLLRQTFPGNFRFWVFCWPVLHLPLAPAAKWYRLGRLFGRMLDWVSRPADSIEKIRSKISKQPILSNVPR